MGESLIFGPGVYYLLSDSGLMRFDRVVRRMEAGVRMLEFML